MFKNVAILIQAELNSSENFERSLLTHLWGYFHKFFEFSFSYDLLLLVFQRVPCSSSIPITKWISHSAILFLSTLSERYLSFL